MDMHSNLQENQDPPPSHTPKELWFRAIQNAPPPVAVQLTIAQVFSASRKLYPPWLRIWAKSTSIYHNPTNSHSKMVAAKQSDTSGIGTAYYVLGIVLTRELHTLISH